MTFYSRWGRGIWSPRHENYIRSRLLEPKHQHLSLKDVKEALSNVAKQRYGLEHQPIGFDAFAFCHQEGLLHSELPPTDTIGVPKYSFASPLHRRIAYRRLFSGREPDAVLQSTRLQQMCMNAIARFSPSALQSGRRSNSRATWTPEIAFQQELYTCMHIELHHIPILSDYAHTQEGRIDFYISEKKWGIELLRCGTARTLAEHVNRFTKGGKYQKWHTIDDFIILNFFQKSINAEKIFETLKIEGTSCGTTPVAYPKSIDSLLLSR